MNGAVLDIDEELVRALQLDGRAHFSALAQRVGAHRAVVADRVRALFETGEVRVIAAVHPTVLGVPIQAHLMLVISGPTSPVFERIAAHRSVAYLSEVTGEFQAVVEVWAESHEELASVVAEVRAIQGVVEVRFGLYERVMHGLLRGEEPTLPGAALDACDLELIAHLQGDGRLTFGELSRRTGRSPSACRSRVLRLLDARVIRIGAVRTRMSSHAVLFGIGIVPSDETAQQSGSVEEYLLALPGIELVVRAVGRYSLIATVSARSLGEYTRIIRGVREHHDVRAAETWVHAPVWVERYEWGFDRVQQQLRADPQREKDEISESATDWPQNGDDIA